MNSDLIVVLKNGTQKRFKDVSIAWDKVLHTELLLFRVRRNEVNVVSFAAEEILYYGLPSELEENE